MKKLGIGIVAGVMTLSLAACGGSGSSDSSDDAAADGYPEDDITMIVTYAAGGPTDIAGRAVAASFEKELGVSVVVENVEGASGAVGSAQLSQAQPDGLTVAMTTVSAVSRVPLIEEVGFTLDDVIPIGIVTEGAGVILVPEDSPYETIDDLVEAAKDNPGEVTIGAAGAQTPQAVEIERMKSEYDVPLQLVPFQGDAPSLTALLGGNVDAIVPSYNEAVRAQVEAGAIRPIAVLGPERADYLPEVPTLAESGFEDLIYGISSFILIAPAGTPDAIVAKLEEALEGAVKDEETYAALDGEILVPDEFTGSDELETRIQEEIDVIGDVLQELFG
ncbi:tripartite tricarboxylate transporter substrate binding protein [Aeromicrobium sp. Sec7.5]|uniref:tripartite tricarboxylate transporter substrate binding protein n=1 Tax=Aeromicrobium sp. Sec7.5 TaxID=3121276 RepID=UPI002FE4BD1A